MSGDEMVFGDVKYREPARMPRPDRERRWACLSYKVPGPADLPIFLDHHTADAIERHALSDTSVELGGILLGKECLDQATSSPFVWVTQALEAKHYANTQASFTYTHDSWEEISRERDKLFPDLDIVGWYHTHPSFGIFLSHHDLFIHQHFFAQPMQVAYVVDPIQQSRGFFQWRGGEMAQVEGFYLTAERADRITLARLVNDLENLPQAEGRGGGTFSPRLEAELIKMLNRTTNARPIPPVDRVQFALLFAMLGSLLGMLGVAAGLWLYQLNGRMQEQGDAIKILARSVEQLGEGQRLATDTLLEKAGVQGAAQFAAQYERAAKARDESRRQLLAQQSINETLGARTRELESKLEKLTTELVTAQDSLERNKTAVDEAPKLRERLVELEQSASRQRQELEDKSRIAETVEGKQVESLYRQLNLYKYASYLCATLALLLGGAFAYLYRASPGAEEPVAEPERTPHRIT